MNILILNGSPRGSQSNTLKITNAFIDGMNTQSKNTITTIDVRTKKIAHCLGCFICWKETPGVCVIKDDMAEILPLLIKADLVIWSFPLYYFSMPSKIKALMDRTLPLNLPFMEALPTGAPTHPPRYDLSHQRTVLISTCGFYSTTNNYEALETQFDLVFGTNKITKILCPEGELFSQVSLRNRTEEYLGFVRTAGVEYDQTGAISEPTKTELKKLLFPKHTFITMANASWGITQEKENSLGTNTETGDSNGASTSENSPKKLEDPSSFYVIQMATLYNPRELAGNEALLEFHFTDSNSTHRLHLGKSECTILSGSSYAEFTPSKLLPLTRIETTFSIWKEIGEGKIDGPTAMMEGKYRVLGNFDLMLKMNTLFSGPDTVKNSHPSSNAANSGKKKNRNLALVILPWLPLWVALPISPFAGMFAALAGLALFQLAGFKWKIGTHERITVALVSLVSLAIAANVPNQILIPLTYTLFGLHWLISCAFPVPLTARYSSSDYGGDEALKNPLFIKTNRIICVIWGLVYLATSCWTYFLLASALAPLTGAINSIPPALCGLWTMRFPKWYTAKVARGKRAK